MEEMELAIQAVATPTVMIWINWMMGIFMTSLVFAWRHVPARIVLASFILTLPAAILVFNISKSAHLIGVAHIIIWGPLAYYLVRKVVMISSFKFISFYGVWMSLLLVTIVISLVFDIRDVTMILLGVK